MPPDRSSGALPGVLPCAPKMRFLGLWLGSALRDPLPLIFESQALMGTCESSAQREDRCFYALPSLEPSEPNTPNPGVPPRSTPAHCLRLTPSTGLSRTSLQSYHHSLPPPGPRSPRPGSYLRCPRANLEHSPTFPHVGRGLAPSFWTSMKIASSRPGL